MSQDVTSSRFEATLNLVNSHPSAGRDINLNIALNKESSILTHLKSNLNPVPSASYDSYEAAQRTECFPNTRVKVLDDILAWVMGGSRQVPIYVLDGVAGIGKSTIAQTIAARSAKLGILGASFFFSRDEDLRKVARHFFPTIAYQLACYDTSFATSIADSLEQNPDAPTKRLYQQFSLLLVGPLGDVLSQRERPILIVVDALDECENESANELLSLLGQYVHRMSGLKILITARPEWHLRQVLDQDQNHERFRLHDIEKSVVQSDIQVYLHSRLSPEEVLKIYPNRRKPWQPSADDMKTLCSICGTLFIIAATATKFLLQPQSSPQRQLSLLLKGVSLTDSTGSKQTNVLDETYLRIIFATQPDLDEVDEEWFRDLNRILGALITLATPLPCETLASLLEMDADDLEATLSNLHSLVAPTGDEDMTFRIHHKSFPDFMTDRERIQRVLSRSWKSITRPNITSLLWIDIYNHHLQLARACLRVMNDQLKWNMADIDQVDWYKDKTDLPHVVPELISRELTYASLHWASHLLRLQNTDVDTDVEMYDYLDRWSSTNILHWIEVMVILNRVGSIYGILQDAISSIKSIATEAWPQRPKIENFLSDTSRFVQQASEVMTISPMHIYRSCLPFIPTGTTIHNTYGGAAKLEIGMERSTQWDPLLMTCVGHTRGVNSVAFSNNGSVLASGSFDGTIRLWNPKTGGHIQTLTSHEKGVSSVAFSKDGSKLLSGSFDQTVRLWDVRTGSHLLTLSGHSDQVNSVALSSDSSQLASGSGDQTIRVWDPEKGMSIAALRGHTRAVNAVVFSPDDSRLVSGSTDYTIRIWDAKTHAIIFTITEHSGSVRSVVFSSDGAQLASGAWDKTARLWDATTGAQIRKLVGHPKSEVVAVAFSSNDSKLAGGTLDHIIMLWDVKSGAHISTLAGHSDWVKSVVFSNDGSRLASGSRDATVRLWDTSTWIHQSSESSPATSRHSGSVTSVAFSEDGSRLASASGWGDNTIRLWDTKTGIQVNVLQVDEYSSVSDVTFLPNSLGLASGSSNKVIHLWNGETGLCILTLTGHQGRVTSVAFSKDRAKLASGSFDNTVRIWNAITGVRIFTGQVAVYASTSTRAGIGETIFTGHWDHVKSVAFSNDSLQLASGSDDRTVQIWDTETYKRIHCLTGHSEWVLSVAFSVDDSLLISLSPREICLWNLATGTLRSTLDGEAFSLASLVSVVLLPCDSRKDCTSLLLLVRRKTPYVTGLVQASLCSGDEWEIDPLCWFPPDMEASSFAFHQREYRIAVGCSNGRIMMIDFSSEMSRLLS